MKYLILLMLVGCQTDVPNENGGFINLRHMSNRENIFVYHFAEYGHICYTYTRFNKPSISCVAIND